MQKLIKEQALAITGYTGITALPFNEFHEDVEKRLGRGVWTHEFASPDMWEEIKSVYKEDFLAMCAVAN